jgi:phosphoserine phosphatase
MEALALDHFREWVEPHVYAKAVDEVETALSSGVPVALLTATNAVVAAPVARFFGIGHVLATQLEVSGRTFTGRAAGTYCMGPGKIAVAGEFCRRHGIDMESGAYYGDSLSDVPMLASVAFPVVCNPGEELACLAQEQLWRCLDFPSMAAGADPLPMSPGQ